MTPVQPSHDDLVATLSAHGEALVAAVQAAPPDQPVACCPGWTTPDLAAHVTNVYRHKLPLLLGHLDRAPDPGEWIRARPDDPGLVPELAAAHAELVEALAAYRGEEPLWSWHPGGQTARFWSRRMAHETLIHRIDAEGLLGRSTPIPATLATDGIDELVEVFLGRPAPHRIPEEVPTRPAEPPELVALVAADTHRSWQLRLAPDAGGAQPPGERPADLTITGPADPLLRYVWGRSGLDELTVDGPEDLEQQFRSYCAART
ncbi:MAG: maleylpyruvate isomerase family mycothiol-dependent enzyme [Actinomycetes bacterium]